MSESRRDFGKKLLAGIATASFTGACGSGSAAGTDAGAGGGDAGNSCTLYPEQTAGPFYLDLDLLRREITEGQPGTPLTLVVNVQSTNCEPLKDLVVDVWHCDASGVYSGFPGQLGELDTTGQTFLRGSQVTGDAGVAQFETIFPGWYPGRTTHIHFRVHTSSTTQATSQLYFPEDVSEAIYETAAYAARGQKDTPNAADGIAVANPPPLATVAGDAASAYTATIVVTVA